MNSPRRPGGSTNTGTFLALFAILALAAGLLVLTAMVLPSVFGILAVVFGFFLFGVFHYVVWGWWLGRPSDPEEDERADQDQF